MRHFKNQNGFSGLEVVLMLVVTALVVGGGVYALNLHGKQAASTSGKTATTLSTPKEPAFQGDSGAAAVTKNGITISTPKANASVGRTFSLVGKAPGKAGSTLVVTVDDDTAYLLPANRKTGIAEGNQVVKVNADGTFSIPMDLTGDACVQSVKDDTFSGILEGKHKFRIDIAADESSVSGPEITLQVN